MTEHLLDGAQRDAGLEQVRRVAVTQGVDGRVLLEREGLGDDLLVEADRVLNEIAASPSTWLLVPGSKIVRCFLFTRFPYVTYFVIQG